MLKSTLLRNTIKNNDISVQDVARAMEIWGKDLANLKGKTTAKKAPIVPLDSVSSDIKSLVQREQTMLVDLMFVNGLIYIIGIFNPSDYLEIKRIKGKNSEEILRGIKEMIHYLEKKGFQIKLIRSDEESAIESKYVNEHLNIEVDTTGGEHVGAIERKIRTVKERLRGIINT